MSSEGKCSAGCWCCVLMDSCSLFSYSYFNSHSHPHPRLHSHSHSLTCVWRPVGPIQFNSIPLLQLAAWPPVGQEQNNNNNTTIHCLLSAVFRLQSTVHNSTEWNWRKNLSEKISITPQYYYHYDCAVHWISSLYLQLNLNLLNRLKPRIERTERMQWMWCYASNAHQ